MSSTLTSTSSSSVTLSSSSSSKERSKSGTTDVASKISSCCFSFPEAGDIAGEEMEKDPEHIDEDDDSSQSGTSPSSSG